MYARVCETRSGYYAVGLHLTMLEIGLNEFWPSVRCSSVDLQKVERYTDANWWRVMFCSQIGTICQITISQGCFFQLKRKTDVKWDILDVEKHLWQNNGLAPKERNGWNSVYKNVRYDYLTFLVL